MFDDRARCAGPRTIRAAQTLVVVIGWAAAVVGPVYAINGATRAQAAVDVPVELRVASGSPVSPVGPQRIPVDVAGLPDTVWVSTATDAPTLAAWDSTVAEQLLARGDDAVLGLTVGAGCLVLHRLLRNVAAGRPFAIGAARRMASLAGLVLVGGVVGPVLPHVAAAVVLARLGLDTGTGPFLPGLRLDLRSVLLAALLLVLAEAFRRGEQLTRDAEGLARAGRRSATSCAASPVTSSASTHQATGPVITTERRRPAAATARRPPRPRAAARR